MSDLPPGFDPEYFCVVKTDSSHRYSIQTIEYTKCPHNMSFQIKVRNDNFVLGIRIKYSDYNAAFTAYTAGIIDNVAIAYDLDIGDNKTMNNIDYINKFSERGISKNSYQIYIHYFNHVKRAQMKKLIRFIRNEDLTKFPEIIRVFCFKFYQYVIDEINEYYKVNGSELMPIFDEIWNDKSSELWDPIDNDDNTCFL